MRYDNDEAYTGKTSSDYVIAGKNLEALDLLVHNSAWRPVKKPEGIEPWTDDYSNMLEIVRWR